MSKSIKFFAVFAIFAAVLTLMPDLAFADVQGTAGSTLKNDLIGMLKGQLGTLVGLGISLLGLYMWIVKQETWGIMVVLGGALITAFPSAFDSISSGVAGAFEGVKDTGRGKADS